MVNGQPRHDDPDTLEIQRLVQCLFRAENGDPAEGDEGPGNILAPDYLPITRARGGVDESRQQTLDKIAGGGSLVRHVERATIDVDLFMDSQVAIARTLLPTTDRSKTPSEVSYRNLHVFLKREDEWKCIAWQVTQVQ